MKPLLDRGARCTVESVDGGVLVVAEGPPELEPALVTALTSSAGALFVEGASSSSTRPALVARTPAPAPPVAAGTVVLPLAPTASLFDVEGEALVAWLRTALGTKDVALAFAPGRASVVMHAPLADVQRAVTALADKTPAPAQIAALDVQARSTVAERRARIGMWARDMARAWLVCGDASEGGAQGEGQDLGARLRSRLIVQALRGPLGPDAPATPTPRGG